MDGSLSLIGSSSYGSKYHSDNVIGSYSWADLANNVMSPLVYKCCGGEGHSTSTKSKEIEAKITNYSQDVVGLQMIVQ